jgi:hypothetical protein
MEGMIPRATPALSRDSHFGRRKERGNGDRELVEE